MHLAQEGLTTLIEATDTQKTTRYSLIEHFQDIPDPRIERNRDHPLINILFIALCAMLCGAEDFVAFEEFGNAKIAWLRTKIDMKAGIPSHDTFGRVFARIAPKDFQECFEQWVQAIRTILGTNSDPILSASQNPSASQAEGVKEILAFDGKTLRRSFDTATGKAALHLVSAWACQQKLVFGQEAVRDKSNEITAIPALLKRLDIAGCLVTTDALGCQKQIARQIIEQGGDYFLALKDNHPLLHEAVEKLFAIRSSATSSLTTNATQIEMFSHLETEKGHGRIDTRLCRVIRLDALDGWDYLTKDWCQLHSLVQVTRQCRSKEKITGKEKLSQECRYFITSVLCQGASDAPIMGRFAREHWGVENRLHWVLDVGFREDDCRVRIDHGAENLAILRHFCVNLLSQERTSKVGVKNRRLRAGWDDTFLERLLTN
ncbi:ISAs1 family transposase [Armatimonas sp.]|uniref:ISAs1 family transposase n=1 Tax=Armatimonas sp. TaxID=1872638 RepID=UPI003751267E